MIRDVPEHDILAKISRTDGEGRDGGISWGLLWPFRREETGVSTGWR